MPYCWVRGCKNGARTKGYRKMFRFPKKNLHPELAEEWWVRINRPEAEKLDSAILFTRHVCGMHFRFDEIQDKEVIPITINNEVFTHVQPRDRYRLEPGSVPSVLPGPGHFTKSIRDSLLENDYERRSCSIDSCPNHNNRKSLLNIILPPKDPEKFAKWAATLQPHCSSPITRISGVCELHFQKGDILRKFKVRTSDGTMLKLPRGWVSPAPDAVPTLFGKDVTTNKKSSCIEVSAPSTTEKDVTYIFDIGDDEDLVEESSDTNLKRKMSDGYDLTFQQLVGPAKKTVVADDVDVSSEIHNNYDKSKYMELRHVSVASGNEENRSAIVDYTDLEESELPETDIRKILNQDDPEKSIVNNKEIIGRLCRSFIVSKSKVTGRRNASEMRGNPDWEVDSAMNPDVFLYPSAKDLDVITLLNNIDRVKLPSDNWFCTIKDGSPAFLCWCDGYKINKKVVFSCHNLDPTIIIGDNEVKLSEVIKPRSIKEIGSILKLADSVELCTQFTDEVRPFTQCKGYFFRSETEKPDVTQCFTCRSRKTVLPVKMKPMLADSRVSYEEICEAAESIVKDRELWSYTIIGSALVFLGWWKQYCIDKLFIVNNDISTKVKMGDQFVSIDEIEIKTLTDVAAALDFLGNCRRCQGIRNVDNVVCRRAEDCRGFISGANPTSRVWRCTKCEAIKTKVRLRNYRQRMKGQFVRSSEDQCPTLKLKTTLSDKIQAEDVAGEGDEGSDECWLVDVLEKITFPSISWSYVVVDNCIVFLSWNEGFVVSKKIVINPDLNVQIYVMDNHVEIETVDTVENVDDVIRLLNIVDCIQICDGIDDNSKSENCTGYFYDPDMKSSEEIVANRCQQCAKEHRLLYAQQNLTKRIKVTHVDMTDL